MTAGRGMTCLMPGYRGGLLFTACNCDAGGVSGVRRARERCGEGLSYLSEPFDYHAWSCGVGIDAVLGGGKEEKGGG